jgi:polyisoprenyl-phosphate glycosyltransferase
MHAAAANDRTTGSVEISVVVPVFRCEECLRPLYDRTTSALADLGVDYELLFVDDRSPDGSWAVVEELAARDPAVRAVRLSRNFGQHAAITAGLSLSRGRWCVVMDCDLQDPPEQIGRLYAKAKEGYDIVLSRRVGRRHSLFRRVASRAYYRLLKALVGTQISGDVGNYSIISQKVRNAFLGIRDKDRHFLLILLWLGFETTTIEFPHAERFAGESSYTFRTLVRFALAGLFFQTTTLLRWVIYLGFCISVIGAGLATAFIVTYFVVGNRYPGWTSLAVLLILLTGFVIVSTGVTGLYVGKIFTQVKDRPLYVVDETLNASSSPSLELERAEQPAVGEPVERRP